MMYGAIDIGSNAIRLLIGSVNEGDGKPRVKKINLIRLPIRLGQEVFDNNEISKPKIRELIDGLSAFVSVMRVYKVKQFEAFATSALRESSNSEYVLKKIKKYVGIDGKCISGDDEAKLIFGAFEMLAMDFSREYLSIDVGGGSTELTLLRNGKQITSQSFKLGTVRLMNGKDEPAEWDRMKHWILEVTTGSRRLSALGTGGNINRFLKMSHTKTQGFVTYFEMQSLSKEMEALTLKERVEKFRLREDRADVIVPASKIYLFAMEYGNIDLIQVPKIGLTDGMIYAMHQATIGSQQLSS